MMKIFPFSLGLALVLVLACTALAQNDVVVGASDGKTLKGTIWKYLAKEKQIDFESEGFRAQFPVTAYSSITLAQRPEYKKAQAAMAAKKYDDVISLLQPLVDNYLGMQSKWLVDAATTLAQAYALSGKRDASESAYKKIAEAYPDNPVRFLGEMGRARNALSRKQWDDALKIVNDVEPKLPEDAKSAIPAVMTMQLLSDMWFIRGAAYEGQGKKQEALSAYLKVATLYYHPEDQAKEATQRADKLRESDAKLRVE